MSMRPHFQWRIGSRTLSLGPRTLVMGVLNVTPDSFSDGGMFLDRAHAVEHALRMLDEGADIVDVGGESTRPGASVAPGGTKSSRKRLTPKGPVSEKEELARILPVITELKRLRPGCVISVDTYKARVAEMAVDAGADIMNDISAFRWDKAMPKTAARLHCGVVLMHMRGRPEDWRSLPSEPHIAGLVSRELRVWAQDAMEAGVDRDRIVIDPGFGFGKNFEENYPLLNELDELQKLGFPLLAGTSRKSFVGKALEHDGKPAPASQRLYGSLAAMVISVLKGAHIVRVHDVKASREAVRMVDAVLAG